MVTRGITLSLIAATLLAVGVPAPAQPPVGNAGDADGNGGLQPVTPDALETVLAGQRGKIVVLNLWATWCVPCLREIPDLLAVEEALIDAGKPVVLVPLGMDDAREFARVEAFRQQHFPGFFSYLRDAADMDSMITPVDPAWNELLPTTYLLDADGRVAKRIQGKRTREQFVAEIRAVLGD